MKCLVLFILTFYVYTGLYAYNPALKPDRHILVQFSAPAEINALDELSRYSFITIEPLNVEKTLYRFGYHSSKMSDEQATQVLAKVPFYMFSQMDGEIFLRKTVPNDTFFYRQWHLDIIKATEAWDVCRSPVNRQGDTIVIAVIDEGLHLKHPDFQGNIWINYADTAGNGIDDDNNGYIDDHYGWNFMGENKDISDSTNYNAGHGTPVAGIIGARGNNVAGVAGIMWNVKLMIVTIADTGIFPSVFQSDAIRAYSYVLRQRKLYNSTQGKQGAFVVATNSSWGVNNKFPNQAPLWCAMYDSLGAYGILNVAAASNSNVLVDTDGDMPTLCPSVHLIAVGSTTQSDNFFSCGYSTTNVDLSAPGANIFSTAAYTKVNINNDQVWRSGFSGTSFASPMVTGAVGVLYSYACEKIIDTMKANPAAGNKLIRRFLLEGVDTLQSLAGKNATSGRLNLKRAMQRMDDYCFNLSLKNPAPHGGIVLFPNPGTGVVDILSDKAVENVMCYDVAGKLVVSAFNNGELVFSDVADGVYFIKVFVEGQVYTYKYIKTTP